MPELNGKTMAGLVLLAAIAFAVSPFFTEPFTGFDPAQLPRPVDDPPIQPAGFTFAIWGVIYFWLIIGAGYGLIKRSGAPDWTAMRPPLLLSLVIGAAWIPVALNAPVGATVLIVAMLLSALAALYRAPTSDGPWAAAPVALYAGWLSAASVVAGVTILMAHTGLDGQTAGLVGLLLVGVIASGVIKTTAHPLPYAAAVIWALAGIVVANLGTDVRLVFGGALGLILALCYVLFQSLRASR